MKKIWFLIGARQSPNVFKSTISLVFNHAILAKKKKKEKKKKKSCPILIWNQACLWNLKKTELNKIYIWTSYMSFKFEFRNIDLQLKPICDIHFRYVFMSIYNFLILRPCMKLHIVFSQTLEKTASDSLSKM